MKRNIVVFVVFCIIVNAHCVPQSRRTADRKSIVNIAGDFFGFGTSTTNDDRDNYPNDLLAHSTMKLQEANKALRVLVDHFAGTSLQNDDVVMEDHSDFYQNKLLRRRTIGQQQHGSSSSNAPVSILSSVHHKDRYTDDEARYYTVSDNVVSYDTALPSLQRRRQLADMLAARDSLVLDPSCSNYGVLDYSMQLRNTCIGEYCIPIEVNCNGIIITNDTISTPNIATNSSCFVTKMECFSDVVTLQDMSSQFGASQCVVDRVLCDWRERNLTDIDNKMFWNKCWLQVSCLDTHKRYGFDLYGFYCAQDEFMCNGTVIEGANVNTSNVQFLDSLRDCNVVKRSCKTEEVAPFSSTMCYTLQKTCDGDIVNGCTFSKQFVGCSATQPQCKISSLSCNGTNVNVTSYRGRVGSCLLEEVSCNNGTEQIDTSAMGECKISELVCSGIRVNATTYSGSLDNCIVNKMECNNNDSCITTEFACAGTSICDVQMTKFQCRSPQTCPQQINVTQCICPIDRIAADCSSARPLSCSLDLEAPRPVCDTEYYQDKNDPKAYLLDGDPACLVFSLQETARLRYALHCEFSEPVDTSPAINFTYYIQNDKFAVSGAVWWSMRFKIYNFNVLSDSEATTSIVLDKDQMLGNKPIWFNISLAEVPDKYWAGNRLYAEASWTRDMRPQGVPLNILDRRFLDSPEYKGRGTEKSSSNVVTIVVATVVPIVVVAAVVLYCVLKRKGYFSST